MVVVVANAFNPNRRDFPVMGRAIDEIRWRHNSLLPAWTTTSGLDGKRVSRPSATWPHDAASTTHPQDGWQLCCFNTKSRKRQHSFVHCADGGHVEALLIRRVDRAREQGRRVIAIGTTTVRALESVADPTGRIVSTSGNGG